MTVAAASQDVGTRFLETARRLGPRRALLQGGTAATFEELADEVDRLSRGLRRAGVREGERAAVLVPPSRAFVVAAFALMRAGAVPVLIDPGIGLSRLKRCLAESEPSLFVGSPKAQLARLLGGWAPSARLKVSAGGGFPGCARLEELAALGAGGTGVEPPPLPESAAAAVLFTSGSTGAPKGVVYRHGMFAAQLEQLRFLFGIEEGDVSVATFPLFALFDLALGQTTALPDMDFTRPGSVDPMAIVRPVQELGARQLFGSPALLDRVGRFGERHGIALPSLERVMSAGAPVPARVLERFSKLLRPGTPIHTPYGATEALPVALTDSGEILGETAAATARGEGVCVGRPVPGVSAAVIRVTDGPIASWSESLRVRPGEAGEIAVRGRVVSAEYFRRREDTALAKIGDGEGHWHRMGDLGRLDARGRLWYLGRKSQRVRSPRGDLHTAAVEGVLDAHPAVRRSALVDAAGVPVAVVERDPAGPSLPDAELEKELLERLARHETSKGVRTLLFHPSLPVDIRHNAKIDRESLGAWAARRRR